MMILPRSRTTSSEGVKRKGRAAVVARALKREQRRNLADRDAAILAAASCKEADLEGFADFAAGISMNDLD
ncbi:antitoxin [Mumia zhuanghuii]|uniref:Antitoxin n=1 Tax=Mumia zhuanghuii TaxID=2585211 RepID=A0A5C4MK13_9ACTN|nr:antitoxin [Mumia zhuanghuii]TNC44643.1 antitoxin [Mumia zhuanghuii]TNC51041.1 antitoxin [Mumia zhuanghuii]